ncbi:MAG TPA: hypothetical protein VIO84_08820 [Candidatus Dormibacteraeota bacterium]
MDNLQIEIFTPREKRAAAVFAIALVLLAGSVAWVVRSGGLAGPAASAAGAVPTPPPQRHADFLFVSETAAYALARTGPSYAVASVAAYRSGDGARTWQRMVAPGPGVPLYMQLVGTRSLLLAAGDPNAATDRTYWVTHDAGLSWQRFPVPNLPGQSSYLHLLDGRTGYLISQPYFNLAAGGSPIAIYWTSDAGATWRQTLDLNETHASAGALDVSGPYTAPVFFDPRQGWMMSGSFVPRAGESRPLLLHTADGGATWAAVPLPPGPDKQFLLATPVFPGGGAHGYLALGGAAGLLVYETRDGGAAWADPYRVGVPWFSAGADRWVYSDGRSLLTSRDWGRSWTTTAARLPVAGLALGYVEAAGSALWAYDNGTSPGPSSGSQPALLRSLDEGATWSRVSWPGA